MSLNIGVIIGSTRPGRNGAAVAQWFKEITDNYEDITFTWLDLKEEKLPFYDEPIPPKANKYQNEHTKAWAEKVDKLDGYIYIVNEYNHGPSASVKNSLDFVYKEWNKKPIAFVGYGSMGGVRAIEQLRLHAVELQLAPVSQSVLLQIFSMFNDKGELSIPEGEKAQAVTMLDELKWWAHALQGARKQAELVHA
jgi:NAD(P)H-dependent FMN reductase